MRLEYFGIRVTDLERSLKFYAGLLGLRELRRGKMSHGGLWVVLIDDDSKQQLELNWYPMGSKYNAPYVAGEGLDHLGFKVENARQTFSNLVAQGAEPAIEPWNEDGTWVGYVKDPDGNWIEIYS